MLKPSDPLYRRIRNHAKQRIRYAADTAKPERLKGYKEFLRLEREMISRYHRKGDEGLRVCQAYAILADVMIESIFRTSLLTFSEKHGVLPCKCTLVAHGGFGRGELSPLSDLDIMFLFPEDTKSSTVKDMKTILTDEVLYPLWDLGFKVGHATRTVKECIEEAESDFKTRNSLLEIRKVLGSTELFEKLTKEYRSYLNRKNRLPILEELVEIQKKRRAQQGDSVFVVEPNIKNGVGGLRDFQGVFWMVQLMYGNRRLRNLYIHDHLYQRETKAYRAAYDFLLRVRTELHLNSRRPTDQLTLGIQPTIAQNLGYSGEPLKRVESLMKDYYDHAQRCHQITLSLEKRILHRFQSYGSSKKRLSWLPGWFLKTKVDTVDSFVIREDWIEPENARVFEEDPIRLIRLFQLMQQRGLKMSIELERLVEASLDQLTSSVVQHPHFTKVWQEIMDCSGNIHGTLESMYRLGVLGKIMPEFDKLHCFIQHDRHLVRYSEDEKVLSSLHQLDRVVQSPDGNTEGHLAEIEQIRNVGDLYWAMLVYSLVFQRSNAGNSRAGALFNLSEIPVLLDRMGLGENQIERIVSFVESHSKVARFWHDAESNDTSLIRKLAIGLRTHEQVTKSFCFHYCESIGRNPQYWELHSVKDAIIVYQGVRREIREGLDHTMESSSPISKKEMTRAEISTSSIEGVTFEEVDAHFKLLPERYFEARNTLDVKLHIHLVHQLLETIQQAESLGTLRPITHWKNDPNGGFSMINIVTWDRLGLFYKLAGAISAVGLNILKASAVSRNDHIAIDTFYVSHGKTGQVECDEVKARFEDAIKAILVDGEKAIELVREQYQRTTQNSWSRSQDVFDASLPVQADIHWDDHLKQVVVDYQGKDRIGLLYRISRLLFLRGYNLDSVRISSANHIASGTVMMSKESQLKPDSEDELMDIREKLIAILSSEVWLED